MNNHEKLKSRTFGIKTCLFCGKQFEAKSPNQNVCPDIHYAPCPRCGKPVQIKESWANFQKSGARLCKECARQNQKERWANMSAEDKAAHVKKQQESMMKKYGAANPMQVKEFKQKAKDIVRERYGVDNLSQSAEIQNKIRQNSLKKYGVEHYSNALEVRQKMQQGMVEKYGVDNAMKSEELHEKAEETNLEKYGVKNVFGSKEIQEKIRQTNLEKYGVEYATQASEVIEKRTQTNLERYGAPAYIFSDEFLSSLIEDPSKKDEYAKFHADPKGYIQTTFKRRPTIHQISNRTGLGETQVSAAILKYKLQNLVIYRRSNMEQDVVDFIKSLDESIVAERNCRTVIPPKEIDIYLPDYKLGIECNPTSSHNSSIPFIDADIVPPSYHRMKSDLCTEKGIFLLHLFGYEWNQRNEVMKSIIENLLYRTPNKIYARKCEIKDVSFKDSCIFLDSNHRQGQVKSSVRLGLYYENKLISLMTFIKINDDMYELNRFCSKLHTNVVGGANKLFQYFVKTYKPPHVISYSDYARSRGNLYETLGFKFDHLSDPSYVWVDYKSDCYYHRATCQKSNLRSLLNDKNIDLSRTEREIMLDHGFVQVYDCGVKKWIWKSESL